MKSLKNLIKWYFSKASVPYWGILAFDCSFVALAAYFTLLLSRGSEEMAHPYVPIFWTIGAFLVCFAISFRIFHTYEGIIRYSSFADFIRVCQSVLVAVIIIYLCQLIFTPLGLLIPFSIIELLILGGMVIACMWLMRCLVKIVFENMLYPDLRSRAFVLGFKDNEERISKTILSPMFTPFRIEGLIPDQPGFSNHRMYGMKVYNFDDSLPVTMKKKGVTNLLVSPTMMDTLRDNEKLVNDLVDAGIQIFIMPPARHWKRDEDMNISDFHQVDVEDLLPRDSIQIDMKAAGELLKDQVVMITGAAGSIGSEMVRQIATFGAARLVLIDQAETPLHDMRLFLKRKWPELHADTIIANISDKVYMERIFKEYKPTYIFHAAAYKHVPMMEDNPYQSIYNNVKGTKILADLAVKYNTKKFVMVSTDKAVNPTNVMGCSKRICEIYVQSLDRAIKNKSVRGITSFVTTRFGNVLGSNGSVIPLFQEQIRNGGPVTVTHPEIIRYFMLIPEACRLVIEAGTIGNGGEIYVFDMGQPVRIVDLAKRMIRLSGAKNIEIVFTGLRDGEKLYEEVLNNEETTLPTFHPKIKIAKVREANYEEVEIQISNLINSLPTADDMELVAQMKKIVPEFKSQHSKYEVLDTEDRKEGKTKSSHK